MSIDKDMPMSNSLRERLFVLAAQWDGSETMALECARLALDEAIRECHLDEGDATSERASKRIARLAATLTP